MQGGSAQDGGMQGGGGGTTDAQGNPLQSSKTHARAAVDDIRTAATQMAGDYRGRAEEAWGQAQDRVRTFQEDGETYVRENPTKAVFTALGIGFVLGIIFRR